MEPIQLPGLIQRMQDHEDDARAGGHGDRADRRTRRMLEVDNQRQQDNRGSIGNGHLRSGDQHLGAAQPQRVNDR
ncbi:Uncharacterised protein [Mycobacteroides abscessus subsp. abscessus]|nr:Uncharacterised protein [Mycobacteroides abscessus subsp. abscessus]